ncbi:hypothetical protein Tasa_022_018 [Tanticharoenia sakaeratensis NBRC 103193]|uniref:Cupin n=2 Tax=Tanticharoenia TaxID=444052 RepID=A0A0D6MLF7_9PROT|nr:hypothetical protein Tasa_022_018 [Tanticharoenia sakaeratensis NBRC 103193]
MNRRACMTLCASLLTFPTVTAPAFAQISATGSQTANVAPGTPQPASPRVAYWDNWTDAQGVSHLTKCNLTSFQLKLVVPQADKEWLGRPMHGAATVVTNVQPAHWKGGWHQNPRIQWIVPTSGTLFMQAMDGTRVELNPGDALLGEDLDTRRDKAGHVGHLSGNVGDGPVTLLITQFDDARASHKPCPVQ